MIKQKLLDLDKKQLDILKEIIQQQIPDKTVWVYGSRVTWKANEVSDIDLTVFDCTDSQIYRLKETLEESDLLFTVDVMNWEEIPDNFKTNIKKQYVVLQEKNTLKGWREVKLGEVVKSNCQNIGKDYEYSQILYLDTGSITAGKIQSLQNYQVSQAPSRAKRLVRDEDIVYSNVRPIQRHYGFIKNPPDNLVVSTGFSVIETNQSNADPRFIYHLLASNNIVEKLDSIAEGATSAYPALKPSDIEDLKVSLPPLPEQKAIAEVLSSLDDKIDLLHRQNKTLENMAQTLFRQWFVEQANAEWEVGKIPDEFDFIMGQSPPGKSYNEEQNGIPMFQGNADFGFRFPANRIYTTQPKRFAEKYDTLISVRAPVGEQNMAKEKCCIGRGVATFRYKNNNSFYTYTYFKMMSLIKAIQQYNQTGTVFGSISKSDFQNMEIMVPPIKLIKKFQATAKPIDDKIVSNEAQINTLENLRDILLPKLMSGEIGVNN